MGKKCACASILRPVFCCGSFWVLPIRKERRQCPALDRSPRMCAIFLYRLLYSPGLQRLGVNDSFTAARVSRFVTPLLRPVSVLGPRPAVAFCDSRTGARPRDWPAVPFRYSRTGGAAFQYRPRICSTELMQQPRPGSAGRTAALYLSSSCRRSFGVYCL